MRRLSQKGALIFTRDGSFFIEVSQALSLPLFQFGDRQLYQVHLGCGEPFPELLGPKVEGVPGAEAELADKRVDATQIPRIAVGAHLGDEVGFERR